LDPKYDSAEELLTSTLLVLIFDGNKFEVLLLNIYFNKIHDFQSH